MCRSIGNNSGRSAAGYKYLAGTPSNRLRGHDKILIQGLQCCCYSVGVCPYDALRTFQYIY
jgi:hypothetical protein